MIILFLPFGFCLFSSPQQQNQHSAARTATFFCRLPPAGRSTPPPKFLDLKLLFDLLSDHLRCSRSRNGLLRPLSLLFVFYRLFHRTQTVPSTLSRRNVRKKKKRCKNLSPPLLMVALHRNALANAPVAPKTFNYDRNKDQPLRSAAGSEFPGIFSDSPRSSTTGSDPILAFIYQTSIHYLPRCRDRLPIFATDKHDERAPTDSSGGNAALLPTTNKTTAQIRDAAACIDI